MCTFAHPARCFGEPRRGGSERVGQTTGGDPANSDRAGGDAAVIAHFAEAVQPPARAIADASGELLTRRRQIIGMMTAERNRRHQLTQLRLVKTVDRVLATLQKQLSAVEADIDTAIGRKIARTLIDHASSVPENSACAVHDGRGCLPACPRWCARDRVSG